MQPALAASWQRESGDHRWEFRLRPGVHFQDGSPLTATDVVMSLNLACLSNCPWKAARAAGTLSVIFTSDSPLPNLPALLTSDAFLIALTHTADGLTPLQPIGTGPFKVASAARQRPHSDGE